MTPNEKRMFLIILKQYLDVFFFYRFLIYMLKRQYFWRIKIVFFLLVDLIFFLQVCISILTCKINWFISSQRVILLRDSLCMCQQDHTWDQGPCVTNMTLSNPWITPSISTALPLVVMLRFIVLGKILMDPHCRILLTSIFVK